MYFDDAPRIEEHSDGWASVMVGPYCVIRARNPKTVKKWLQRARQAPDLLAYAKQRQEVQDKVRWLDKATRAAERAGKGLRFHTRVSASLSSHSRYIRFRRGSRRGPPILTVRISDHPPASYLPNLLSLEYGEDVDVGVRVAAALNTRSP